MAEVSAMAAVVRSAAGSVVVGSVAATEEVARAVEVRAAGVPRVLPAPGTATAWCDGCGVP